MLRIFFFLLAMPLRDDCASSIHFDIKCIKHYMIEDYSIASTTFCLNRLVPFCLFLSFSFGLLQHQVMMKGPVHSTLGISFSWRILGHSYWTKSYWQQLPSLKDQFLAQIGHSPYYLRVLTLPSVTV
jgi:hypothetical protein